METYREPLREILFQDHVYNESVRDIFFLEVTLKNYNNYVTDVRYAFYPLDLTSDDLNEWTVNIRAYSLTRSIWVKDCQPLAEVINIMKREGYLREDVKLIYYSMIKDAAILVAHKVVFSEEAAEVKRGKKMTYDLKGMIGNRQEFMRMKNQWA